MVSGRIAAIAGRIAGVSLASALSHRRRVGLMRFKPSAADAQTSGDEEQGESPTRTDDPLAGSLQGTVGHSTPRRDPRIFLCLGCQRVLLYTV